MASTYSDSAGSMVSNAHKATDQKEATVAGLSAIAFALLDVAEAIREASRKD